MKLIRRDTTPRLTDKLFSNGPVVEHNGRFYITFDNPGFNSPANNRTGYATKAKALAAINRYSTPRRTR